MSTYSRPKRRSLGGDHQLVPVDPQVLFENAAKVLFRAARLGAVVVGQVKLGDAPVKGGEAQLPHVFKISGVAEVVPQAQGHLRQHQAAVSAAVIFHGGVSVFGC